MNNDHIRSKREADLYLVYLFGVYRSNGIFFDATFNLSDATQSADRIGGVVVKLPIVYVSKTDNSDTVEEAKANQKTDIPVALEVGSAIEEDGSHIVQRMHDNRPRPSSGLASPHEGATAYYQREHASHQLEARSVRGNDRDANGSETS